MWEIYLSICRQPTTRSRCLSYHDNSILRFLLSHARKAWVCLWYEQMCVHMCMCACVLIYKYTNTLMSSIIDWYGVCDPWYIMRRICFIKAPCTKLFLLFFWARSKSVVNKETVVWWSISIKDYEDILFPFITWSSRSTSL